MGGVNLVQSSKYTIFVGMSYNMFAGAISSNGIYVYGLTDNGKVFYIGITDNLPQRYKSHFSEMLCRNYISHMRAEGIYPGVIIYGVYDIYGQAEAAEHSLIRSFALSNHKLCNYHQNPKDNVIKSSNYNGKLKRMPQRLHLDIINNAINDYINFRQWQATPILQRF